MFFAQTINQKKVTSPEPVTASTIPGVAVKPQNFNVYIKVKGERESNKTPDPTQKLDFSLELEWKEIDYGANIEFNITKIQSLLEGNKELDNKGAFERFKLLLKAGNVEADWDKKTKLLLVLPSILIIEPIKLVPKMYTNCKFFHIHDKTNYIYLGGKRQIRSNKNVGGYLLVAQQDEIDSSTKKVLGNRTYLGLGTTFDYSLRKHVMFVSGKILGKVGGMDKKAYLFPLLALWITNENHLVGTLMNIHNFLENTNKVELFTTIDLTKFVDIFHSQFYSFLKNVLTTLFTCNFLLNSISTFKDNKLEFKMHFLVLKNFIIEIVCKPSFSKAESTKWELRVKLDSKFNVADDYRKAKTVLQTIPLKSQPTVLEA